MKKIVFLLILFTSLKAEAQMLLPQNQKDVDNRWYHYGFSLGLHSQNLTLTQPEGTPLTASVNGISPGFNIGLVGEARIFKYLSIRTTPSIYFGDKVVNFSDGYKAHVKSNYVFFPIGFKLSGARFNNYRPYFYLGASYALDLSRKLGEPILLKKSSYFAEIAFGLDTYFEYFKLIPELKVSFGLNNVYEQNRPDIEINDYRPYAEAITKTVPGVVSLTFYFE